MWPRRYVSPDQYLQPGDLVIAASSGSRNVVGKAAAANAGHADVSFGAFCTIARCEMPQVRPWLGWFLLSSQYRKYVESVALGININNLRGSDLQRMVVPFAPLPEIDRIVAKVDSLVAKTKRAREELGRVRRLVERYKRAILVA